MNRKPTLEDVSDDFENRFDRSIATANLLYIAPEHFGNGLGDDTVPHAAFHLYQDLQKLKADVVALVDKMRKAEA